MAMKSRGFNLALKEVIVTNEAVSTGDGYITDFNLGYTNIRNNTLKLYLDGILCETGYTADLELGTIAFETAPAVDVIITADYIAGESNLLLEAGAEETILIFNALIINIDTTNAASITFYREKSNGNLSYFTKETAIPMYAPYKPLAGTIVLEPGDKLYAYASALDTLQISLEWKN